MLTALADWDGDGMAKWVRDMCKMVGGSGKNLWGGGHCVGTRTMRESSSHELLNEMRTNVILT